ncbi:probable G-protein coupled receptor 148 [Hyla sarda]|uniref:probable G-protein coupled receptor 148 n=1 Tax=Hyla sarda TaxID=327740 RepID=UPI0024C2558A|nr:probable G-protein coupled receptor 148 [Hyla sarda]
MRRTMNMSHAHECSLTKLVNASIMLQREMYVNDTMEIDPPTHYMIREWIIYPSYSGMNLFLIPVIFCCVIALIFTPSILFSIYSNISMRRETRFLLLGNIVLYDLIYLILYSVIAICNVMNLKMSKHICILILFLLAVTYWGGVLSTASMVVDTYLAVLWPLHYMSLLSARRTEKLLILLWISSFFFPAIVFLALYFTQKPAPCPLELCSLPVILLMALHADDALKLCYILFVIIFLLLFSLIFCCYIVIYYKTRETGIWKSVSSRASVTFFLHHTILFFYLSPLLLLLSESLLYMGKVIGLRTGLWITQTLCNVLLVLPKAASPCLYGLRYREIYKSLKLFLRLRKHRHVAPVISDR